MRTADDKFERHLTAAGALLRRDRLADARGELEAALAARPGDTKALGLLGLVCFRLQAYDAALDAYRQLVAADPSDASYRLNLGLVYLKLGQADRAIAELERTRELDPSMDKAVSYLGLAYARSGNYLAAYEAFRRVGQRELADEMRPHLTAAQIAEVDARLAGTAAPAGTEPGRRRAARVSDAEVAAPPAADAVPGRDAPRAGDRAATDAGTAAREFDEEPARATDGAVRAAQSRTGAITQALEAAAPARDAEQMARPASIGHEPPLPLSRFATQQLIRPEDSEYPFEISSGGVLVVRVRGRILSRTEGVIVSGGELAYEPATRKVRGAVTDEPFGGERPMFIVTGDGHLVASPLGARFSAVALDDDALYVREDLVYAFEDRLRWENGYVPGSDAKIAVVQFRGKGCVALRTAAPVLAVKLRPTRVLYVDVDALAGWVGRVVPRVVAPAAGGEESALFVECSGEGIVLLDDALGRGGPTAP